MALTALKAVATRGASEAASSGVVYTKPDIIVLVETWLKPSIDNNIFSLDDYFIIRRDRILKHTDTNRYIQGGGIACLIHRSLKAKVLHISTSDHLNQPEFMIVDVTLTSGSHLLLSCVYRRPKGLFLNEFFDIFSKLYPNFNNIIIAGDLNCNLLDDSYTANHLKNFITESSLYCVPYGATFHKNKCDSWLDVILLDDETKLGLFTKSQCPFIDVADWARDHGLEINFTKTKATILCSNSKLKKLEDLDLLPIVVNGVIIPYVNYTKCLGIQLSRNLSWNYHVTQIVSKVNSALHCLNVRKNIFSTPIRKLLVLATILPFVDYCSVVLVDSTSDNNLKLQRAINCSIRFMFNLKKDEHITPFRRELSCL
ncbi:Protein of unknown function [Cotesia congregata]|uniref:Endonuclease/exonuclease/phosphatase domain-containing protein n=1 Tax=Cotesia congregata TaxID=51543 RepID=A0A8J2HJJ8_COTCN|nr:Protein of unknown function [Cotesia congregata]